MESVMSSMLFNSKLLWALHRFREQNSQGDGDEVEMDERHEMNGESDKNWIYLHIIVFWIVLILFVEWRFPFCDCSRIGRISDEDNRSVFGDQQEEDNVVEENEKGLDHSESSESVKIGDGDGDSFRL